MPKKKAKGIEPQAGDFKTRVAICLFLAIATLAVYWQVGGHDFVNYDDGRYIYNNLHVQEGLTWNGFVWAFTTTYFFNWHPLTWLSHMLDCQLYGLNPGGHHFTSLLFHIANTVLLFLVLDRMTRATWQSAFVAALFALHPLHVESVAWISERKDVLSTLFWILTMGAYVRYVEHPGLIRYLPVFLFLALGLMAKSMLVTLPFVLLLLDYWPLKRFRPEQSSTSRLFLEKVPFFVLVALCSVVTFFAQNLISLDALPFNVRLANAMVSYASYIGKMIWPHHLAAFYPVFELLVWQSAGATLLLGFVSLLVVRQAEIRPYLVVGWLWYIGTLVPVIGLVQVGAQAMADRYSYVPLIGLFIIIAWGIPELLAKWRHRKFILDISIAGLLPILMMCSWLQAGHWQNTVTLFQHALEVTTGNYLAYRKIGHGLLNNNKFQEAEFHFLVAFRINPNNVLNVMNLGIVLAEQGKFDEAIPHLTKAVEMKPDYALAHLNLGAAFVDSGRILDGIEHFRKALVINPNYRRAQVNLEVALEKLKEQKGAGNSPS